MNQGVETYRRNFIMVVGVIFVELALYLLFWPRHYEVEERCVIVHTPMRTVRCRLDGLERIYARSFLCYFPPRFCMFKYSYASDTRGVIAETKSCVYFFSPQNETEFLAKLSA